MRALVWFRSDLRVDDNAALSAACAAADRGVVGVFLLCPRQWRAHDWADIKVEFLLRNLACLSERLKRLKIPPVLRETPTFDEAPDVLLTLARRLKCDTLYSNREYEVNERRRDAAVAKVFEDEHVTIRSFDDQTIIPPDALRTTTGRFYTVFTPFKRAWIACVQERSAELAPPDPIAESLAGFDLSRGGPDEWPAGERQAAARLSAFIDQRVASYRKHRDFPDIDGTSRLSPYLTLGVISPRRCLAEARAANQGQLDGGKAGPTTWISELIWREFYRHVLVGFPRVGMNRAFKTAAERLSAESPSPRAAPPGIRRLEFGQDPGFYKELTRRVDEYFATPGRRRRDCWQMYLKTVILLSCFVASYVLLVFVARTLWQGLLLTALLGLATAAIGFNIQHDGGHQAYSERRWVNRLMAWTMDLIGGSSYRWHWKHAVIHHMYVNIAGYDGDLNMGPLGRLAPNEKRSWFHRWQHLYLWPIYGLIAVKMQLVDDFRFVITGALDQHRVPRPTKGALVTFLVGRAVFFTWAFVIPLLFHPIGVVLFFYFVGSLVLGTAMVLVFIIPHLVADADFPLPRADTGKMETAWAMHQARVTVDFARDSRVLTWLLGGLNYHKEHHLFPLICHVNYPGMSKVVETTCVEFGVPYKSYRSFRAGIAAHYRWLRRMGQGD
jgi:linoleoyl-CoA desaturase